MVGEKDKHKRALQMYLLGRTIIDISRAFGVNEKTVHDWKNKYDWEREMEKQKSATEEQTKESFKKVREGILAASTKMFMAYYAEFEKRLKEGLTLIDSKDAVAFGRIAVDITKPQTLVIEHAQDILSPEEILDIFEKDGNKGNSKTEPKPISKE